MPTKAQPPSSGLRGGLQGGPGTWAVPMAASQEAQQQGVEVEYRVPPSLPKLCEWLVPMATVGWPSQQPGTVALARS